MSYLLALAIGDGEDMAELIQYTEPADVDPTELVAELTSEPSVYELVEEQRLSDEIYPLATRTAREFRRSPRFDALMTRLGTLEMQEVGNLYTASLPAWMAAGLEEAAERGIELGGSRILTLGYGSGDAAEAIPMVVMPGWQDAARRIRFIESLANPYNLDQDAYAALHDGGPFEHPVAHQPGVFYIDRIGAREGHFDDSGIEYYRFHG